MKSRTTRPQTLPARLPSVPDHASGPTRYNEPDLALARDRMPGTRFRPGKTTADLRLQVEQLLLRKEAAPEEAWQALGPEVRTLLVDLLDDPVVQAQTAVQQRLIAVLGQLAIKRGVAPLCDLLSNGSQRAITRTYAANALGRIGEASAVPALAAVAGVKDAMVRRQVAIALGRIGHASAAPHLLMLCRDASVAVSEVAVRAARQQRLADVPGIGFQRASEKKTAARKNKLRPNADP